MLFQSFGAEAGAPLTLNPDVARICFTGSVPTAKVIARAAAENLIPCSFELGGKSPTVILDDADLDLAVDLAIELHRILGQLSQHALPARQHVLGDRIHLARREVAQRDLQVLLLQLDRGAATAAIDVRTSSPVAARTSTAVYGGAWRPAGISAARCSSLRARTPGC